MPVTEFNSTEVWPAADEDFVAGSFRDRDGRVFERDGRIFRVVSANALSQFEAVRTKRFFREAVEARRVVATHLVSQVTQDDSPDLGWAGVLEHQRIDLLTWPYEWSFSMLKDAALLQLELMRAALIEDAILKDATPYNVQFRGVAPCFIDTASVVPLQPGAVWEGYRQFCQLFLYPLLLQAHLGIDFQPFLRGRIDGITPEQFRRMISLRDMFRRGVFTHVLLHSYLSARGPRSGQAQNVNESLRESGFQKELIQNNVERLIRLVQSLKWSQRRSTWSEYDTESEPVRRDATAKEQFVRETLASRGWGQTWDVGCNLGRYSRIAAEHSQLVVALDSDHLTVDRLYRQLKQEKADRITPLVFNPADPSPDLGWRCSERSRLPKRTQPELLLCLAVIHHLVIGANLLMSDVFDWLAEMHCAVIIEFVERDDPQVKMLLANRKDVFRDYSRECFEQALLRRFEIRKSLLLPSGSRTLFYVTPNG